jgi:hypothetical protein
MLYTFQAVPPPIIGSSKLYTWHWVFVEIFLLLTAIVSEFQITHDSCKKQKKLYMFQAVPPPIIRSSKLYTRHQVFVKLFLLLTAIVSELAVPTHSQ